MTAAPLAVLLLALAPAARAESIAASTVSWYDVGDRLRREGKPAEAAKAFANLLEQRPDSGGALEGLTLTCLSLRRNEEALGYARRWERLNPNSAYVQGLEARALHRLRREEEETAVNRRVVLADPCDVRTQRHLDDEMRALADGIFPAAKISKSIGPEQLNTRNPQRIVYAGRSGEVRFRRHLKPALDVVGGVGLDEQIQANETGGFTYFDVLEQTYSLGLEGRPSRDLGWQAEYGQSELSDVRAAGVGRIPFSRAKLGAQWHVGEWDLGANAQRRPKYLRGAGGVNYFALLREADAGVSAAGPLLTMDWLAKASVSDFSERTTYHDASLTGAKETRHELFTPWYSHSEQEFYGATPAGRIGYVVTDGAGLRWRRLVEDVYRLSASYGYQSYRDGNHEADVTAGATAWLPWLRDPCGSRPLFASYRFESAAYRVPSSDYRSTDYHSHTLGAYWRQGWVGAWTTLGYEHGFYVDGARGAYESNAGILEVEAYRRGTLTVSGEGRVGSSTVKDQAYSAGLKGRWSF